jgi:uncharacterized protein (UPF0333 family)
MEKRTDFSEKTKKGITLCISASGNITTRIESRDLKKYLYTSVHGDIIHNSQKVRATRVTTKR